jgi:hypothetical protein
MSTETFRPFCSLLVLAACDGAPAGDDPPDAAGADAIAPDAPADGPGPDAGPPPEVRLADVVVAAPGATGEGYGDPARAVNGVRGGGTANGSLDVYSLAFPPAENVSITLGWTDGLLRNGPGDDLAVFENPFQTSGGPFMDLIVVEVSRDGVTWRALAHDYVTADETVYVRDPAAWVGFAGRTPVLLHAEDNPVDPFDREAAGGDGLDLDDVVGDDAEAEAIRAEGVRQVRLVAAPSRINPDTGAPYVREAIANGADLDGVHGRYLVPSP